MIRTPDYIKRYSSAKVRFLKGIFYEYFKNELSRFLGPMLLDKFIDGLLQRLEDNLPLQDYVKPGQIVWNVVDITTRADSKNTKYIPVTLTLISETDIEKLEKGIAMSAIRNEAIARIIREAYTQGGLLSMRDISLFSWRNSTSISHYRKEYEKEENVVLPHTGSIQDVGSCVSHKKMIIQKIKVDKKDTLMVAKETNHSMMAVDRYIKDFNRVRYCFKDGKDINFTVNATGLRKYLVSEYYEICAQLE